MAYVKISDFGNFVIVPNDGDPADDKTTVLVQTDWDYPGVASAMGWQPCYCGATDGTIDCKHRKTITMINEAYDFIVDHEFESFDALDDFLPEAESEHEQENRLYEYRRLQFAKEKSNA